MAFFPRNSDVAAQETRSPNIDMQTKDLVPRINDFGEVRYRAELPDDSGESTYQADNQSPASIRFGNIDSGLSQPYLRLLITSVKPCTS